MNADGAHRHRDRRAAMQPATGAIREHDRVAAEVLGAL